jgi:hypothetical protein
MSQYCVAKKATGQSWTEQKTFEFASIADAVRDLRRSLHWKSFFDRVQIFGNELTLAKY